MRTNAGYTITHSCVIHLNREVVLGCKDDGNYVTWLCFNGNDYCFGHYFDNYKEALSDFGVRIVNAAEFT